MRTRRRRSPPVITVQTEQVVHVSLPLSPSTQHIPVFSTRVAERLTPVSQTSPAGLDGFMHTAPPVPQRAAVVTPMPRPSLTYADNVAVAGEKKPSSSSASLDSESKDPADYRDDDEQGSQRDHEYRNTSEVRLV